jgi:hypothetical protein
MHIILISRADQISSKLGSSGEDLMTGTPGNDLILGLQGADTIRGYGGSDVIQGDEDTDKLYGGEGDDIIQGGQGSDLIYGENGNDILSGGLDDDMLSGGNGNDKLYGGEGDDVIQGGPSGSGKSILLNIIGALDRPTEAMVSIRRVNKFTLKENEIVYMRNRLIGLIFQSSNLVHRMTVQKNVELPALVTGMNRTKP